MNKNEGNERGEINIKEKEKKIVAMTDYDPHVRTPGAN